MSTNTDIRQWSVLRAIEWCKTGQDTTDEMLGAAQKIEHFVMFGAKLPLTEACSLFAALQDAELMTKGVSPQKAKLVCEHISEWLNLPKR